MARIFVAGATGVIGRRLVPQLLDAGHQLTALTRSNESAARLTAEGVTAVVADVYDRDAVIQAIRQSDAEVVMHQLTAISPKMNPRLVKTQMAATNRLRREATAILLDGAIQAGARRFITQSISFVCRPDGPARSTESEPIYLDAPAPFRGINEAVHAMEQLVTGSRAIEGIALRYGFFSGPGSVYDPVDGHMSQEVRRRRVPIVGSGSGVFSFIHVDDAARATLLAIDRGAPGIYNIVDDTPLAAGEWIPRLAAQLGAGSPFRVPRWLGRVGAGPYGLYLMCQQRGADNSKAREALGFVPAHSSLFSP